MTKKITTKAEPDEWISHTPPFWGLICCLCGVPAFLFFDQTGQPEKGVVGAYAIAILLGVAILCRGLRTKIWFWAFMFVAAIVHVCVVFFFNFSQPKIPMLFAASPFVFADFALMLFLIRATTKLFHQQNSDAH